MFNGNNSMGPADFAAMMGGNGFGGFGGDGFWGFFLLAIIFGMWGGNGFFGGWGGNGGSNGAQAGFYATQADLQRGFDQAALANKIDNLGLSLEHGIKDPGYMITNSFNQAELSRSANQAALLQQMNNIAMTEMQDTNNLGNLVTTTANQTQMGFMGGFNQQEANFAQVRYDMATSDCAIKNAISQAAQDIMLNDNNNYRALHDELIADKLAQKDETIRRQDAMIANLQLAASQAAQNQYLVNTLRPTPVPSYPAMNLYGYMNPTCPGCQCQQWQ